ncbi:hypothetical protein K439DRAFT_1617206 [Ramaria rubella]|nr:hypothetical protein K439DRAFT_1617206 [Ramaria rubella]
MIMRLHCNFVGCFAFSGIVQALTWPFKEGEVKKALEYLARFQQSLSFALNVDQTVLTLTIQTGVEALRDYCRETKQLFQQAGDHEHRCEIHRWLSALDPRFKHENACKK